jgi:hypothetical protein
MTASSILHHMRRLISKPSVTPMHTYLEGRKRWMVGWCVLLGWLYVAQ